VVEDLDVDLLVGVVLSGAGGFAQLDGFDRPTVLAGARGIRPAMGGEKKEHRHKQDSKQENAAISHTNQTLLAVAKHCAPY
jgi:hypothetical protein